MRPVGLAHAPTPASLLPAIPPSCRAHAREVARMHWRVGDPGEPAKLIQDFLDLQRVPGGHPICGASVLISAAAGATMIAAPPAAPTPAPALPDVAVIVYERASRSVMAGGG